MSDRRSRRHTLYAVASFAFVASCGSGASPSSSGSQAEPSHAAATSPTPGLESVSRSAKPDERVGIDEANGEVLQLPHPDFLCMRDPVAFDLSRLTPADGTPHGFIRAWRHVQSTATIPGFVVVYSGTRNGTSAIQVRLGPVHHAAPGMYGFMDILPPTGAQLMGLYPDDPFHMYSVNKYGEWVTAMGKPRERTGFVVSKAVVDARMKADCGELDDVRVTLTLPGKRNTLQPFGDSNVDAEMGPLSVDTDGDGKPDAWKLELTGTALEAMDFKL